jgi:predicted glycoside hydrolase/deacetylase ChbG (UPF0249 family)
LTKKLIINADDFGFTPGVNRGILETMERGVVTSTTVSTNMPYSGEIGSLAARFPNVSIGIHFNLTVGKPLAPVGLVPSLVNDKGEFLGRAFVGRMTLGRIRFAQMVRELDEQVRRLVELGVHPGHFDSHQNKHLYPMFFAAVTKVAERWRIRKMRSYNRCLLSRNPCRRSRLLRYYMVNPRRAATHSLSRFITRYAHFRGLRTPDRLISLSNTHSDGKYRHSTWMWILKQIPAGVSEIYVHPGYVDELLSEYSSYVEEREDEVKVLVDSEIQEAFVDNGIELVSFRDL